MANTVGTRPGVSLGFYYIMLKKPITTEEQILKLKSHNLIIEDESLALKILNRVNYYRFTGYSLQFRVAPNDSNFIKGTSFNKIYALYRFDEEIRELIWGYIEKLEVYYRTIISHYFSMSKCCEPPYDQHYDENSFSNKEIYKALRANFSKERNYYKSSLVLVHHAKNYDNKLPLWAIVEMISFSELSKLYSCMFDEEKNLIASAAGVGRETLRNNLHCFSVLRNKCAHAARLYNTELNPPVNMPKSFLRKTNLIKQNSLFAYVFTISRRLFVEDGKSFISSFEKIMDSYADELDLALMRFPPNWKDLLMLKL